MQSRGSLLRLCALESIKMPSDTTNIVQISEGRITHVSLYSGLAEITRIYKVKLKAGDNKVVISNLPNKLVQNSLRSVCVCVSPIFAT